MRIAVYGETRFPVLPEGPGGLGRATHEIATRLLALGHQVTLYGPAGSKFSGRLQPHDGWLAPDDYDVLFDYSHKHKLSQVFPGFPVLNMIGDKECPWQPPCAVVESVYMKGYYPTARIIPAGIDIDAIPYSDRGGDYLLFMARLAKGKNPDIAEKVAELAGVELKMIGEPALVVDEAEKWRLLGGALGHLAPYTDDASPRAPIEAAACGTPTLCLTGDGTGEHVAEGLTGWACEDAAEMAERVKDLRSLPRDKMRIWAKQEHDVSSTILKIEQLLAAVAAGERW